MSCIINCPILSDVYASTACTNSFFDVFFDLLGNDAHITLTFDGSDYVSDFSIGDDLSFHIQAPGIASDYPCTITAIGIDECCCCCCDCSDVEQITITVHQKPTVSITVDPSDTICECQSVTLTASGADHYVWFDGSSDNPHTFIPTGSSDYSVTGYNPIDTCSDITSVFITVQSKPVVGAGPDRTIPLGSSTEIGVGPALPNVMYTWSPVDGISDVNAFPTMVTPTSDTTYTVVAQRTDVSDCFASDSVTINVCKLLLSDVQFHAFSSSIFSVTGYQFCDEPETRFVSVDYPGAPIQTQAFGTDGFFLFAFINTPIINFTPVTVTVYNSDCASDVQIIPALQQPIVQGIFGAQYIGSLLNFSLALPPELAVTIPPTSDIFEIYSDICAFADTQYCKRFLAGLTITDHSDLFCSDALITKRSEVVFVYCSDNVIYMDDDDGEFTFSITDFMSDTVTVSYSDAYCGEMNEVMNLTGGGFSLQTSDEHFIWINPCFSDPLNIFSNAFSHPLLVIDANSNITDIGLIGCAPLCHNPTSDPNQVCFFKASTIKLGNYLEENFPSDYPDNIDHACHVLYTGPVTAEVVTVDLEHCELIFSNFVVPCSDVNVCDA